MAEDRPEQIGSLLQAIGTNGGNIVQQLGRILEVLSTIGTIAATGGITSSSPTAGIGYTTGAGGTVTQATSKSTGVTLNKVSGQITMNNAALNAGVEVSFTVTNSAVAAADVAVACHASTGTAGAYLVEANSIAAGSFAITVSNLTAGNLSEAIVINFVVIKGATA